MQLLVYFFSQAPRYAVDATQVFHCRAFDTIKPAKLGEQLSPARRPNADNILQMRTATWFCTACAVAHQGKTMRLVAYFLNQVKARIVHGQL